MSTFGSWRPAFPNLRLRYRHRWWFPESGYRQTSPSFLLSGIADGSLPADWWAFLLNRVDVSTLGSLDGEVLFPE